MRGRILLLLALVNSVPAWPLGRVTFGAEFTFWNPQAGVIRDPDPENRIPPGSDRVVRRMMNHLVKNQPKGQKFKYGPPRRDHHNSKGRFTSPNGWWFEWGFDDSVIEINTIPAEVEVYEKYKSDMQDAIFASAANEGFFPALFLGGGHLNLGMSAFEGNNLLLRNFVVDNVFNHNELFLGIFSYDTNNAASIYVQTQNIRRVVASIIRDFDRGDYSNDREGQIEFIDDINSALNMESDACFRKWRSISAASEYSGPSTRMCYFGLNFYNHNRGEASRVEFRAVRAQANMQTWVNQIRLIKGRLLFLERLNRPLPIKPLISVDKLNLEPPKNHMLNPPVDPQQALAAFYLYVTESGEQWKDHRDYVWPQWISGGELKRFENTRWFKKKERRAQGRVLCEDALED